MELVGCSLYLKIALLNDSGAGVTVATERGPLVIAQGEVAEFYYPGEERGWRLWLSAGGCSYAYAAPRTLDHLPQHAMDELLRVVLATDFSIALLPEGTEQIDGFPLRAVAKTCG
jgi:hypothetical protein